MDQVQQTKEQLPPPGRQKAELPPFPVLSPSDSTCRHKLWIPPVPLPLMCTNE